MEKIRFKASFGMEEKVVEIEPVNGAQGTWHLYIDRYYYGAFEKCNGDWKFTYHKAPDWSSGDDLMILQELITAANK